MGNQPGETSLIKICCSACLIVNGIEHLEFGLSSSLYWRELKCTLNSKLKRIETKTTQISLAQLHARWNRYEILSRLLRLNHETWITTLKGFCKCHYIFINSTLLNAQMFVKSVEFNQSRGTASFFYSSLHIILCRTCRTYVHRVNTSR